MFLCPFGLYRSACFGILFVSILCTYCSHFSWYCFISFTIFCAPVFSLIKWTFTNSLLIKQCHQITPTLSDIIEKTVRSYDFRTTIITELKVISLTLVWAGTENGRKLNCPKSMIYKFANPCTYLFELIDGSTSSGVATDCHSLTNLTIITNLWFIPRMQRISIADHFKHLASSKVCVLQNGSVGIQPVSYIKLYRTVCVKCLISLCVFKHRVNTRAMQWIKSNFDTSFASLCLILYKMEYVQYKLSCYYKLLLRELLYVLFHITISTAIEDFRIWK